MNSFGIGFSFIIHHSVFSVPDRLPPRKPASDGSSTDLLRFFPSCLSTPSWVDLEYGLNTKPQLTSAPVSPVAPIISEKPFSRRVPSSLHPVPAVGPGEWIDRLSSSEDGWSAPPATKRGFQQREQPQGQALARQIAYRLCRAESLVAAALDSSRNFPSVPLKNHLRCEPDLPFAAGSRPSPSQVQRGGDNPEGGGIGGIGARISIMRRVRRTKHLRPEL